MTRADRPGLPRRLYRRARGVLGKGSAPGGEAQWQHRRLAGTEQRWTMIRDALGDHDRNVLDIGCNAGLLTARAADIGLLALGVDTNAGAVAAARAEFAERPDLAFMQHTLDRDGIGRLPRFDVVLLLSVYHQWVEADGNDTAEAMLADVVSLARRRVMFETASVARKYGGHVPPALVEHPDGVVGYVAELLERVSPPGAHIRHLGPTPTPDEDEVVRHLFAVDLPDDADGSADR